MTAEDLEYVSPIKGRFTGKRTEDLNREKLETALQTLARGVEDYLQDPHLSSAKIDNLSADKLTAGTIDVTVLLTGLIQAPAATGYRVEIGDATYPLRYWDGVTTKFSLDASGNLVITGTIANSAGAPLIRQTGYPRCKITVAADSFANNTEESVSFDTEVADTDAFWAIANPTYLAIPFTGQYDLKATLSWTVDSAGRRYMSVEADDNTGFTSPTTIGYGSAQPIPNDRTSCLVADTVDLTAGHYIRVRGFQNSGGALSCAARAALTYLGDT